MEGRIIENSLNNMELVAWDYVKAVIRNVFRVHRSKNWLIVIEDT